MVTLSLPSWIVEGLAVLLIAERSGKHENMYREKEIEYTSPWYIIWLEEHLGA